MTNQELLAHAEAMLLSVDRLDANNTEGINAFHNASIAASLLVIARNSGPKAIITYTKGDMEA